MRGILWKWLFFFGVLFWIALCSVDYYREQFVTPLKCADILIMDKQPFEKSDEIFDKKIPPALTFWKTLSMILSVSALVYIKRSSNAKPPNSVIPFRKLDDVIQIQKPTSRNYREYTVIPTRVEYFKNLHACTPSEEPRQHFDHIRKNVVGVEIIQKKLENLEKSVASLRKRRYAASNSSFASGIISGSPEFKQFLATTHSLKQHLSTRSNSSNSIANPSKYRTSKTNIISTSSSGNLTLKRTPRSSKSSLIPVSVSHKKCKNTPTEKTSEKKSEAKSNSSWSTITYNTDEMSINSRSTNRTITNKIVHAKKTFSETSQLTEDLKTFDTNSVFSYSDPFGSEDIYVPGSNLIDSASVSSCSSITILSKNIPSILTDVSSTYSIDLHKNDTLNTLD